MCYYLMHLLCGNSTQFIENLKCFGGGSFLTEGGEAGVWGGGEIYESVPCEDMAHGQFSQ